MFPVSCFHFHNHCSNLSLHTQQSCCCQDLSEDIKEVKLMLIDVEERLEDIMTLHTKTTVDLQNTSTPKSHNRQSLQQPSYSPQPPLTLTLHYDTCTSQRQSFSASFSGGQYFFGRSLFGTVTVLPLFLLEVRASFSMR